MTGFSEWLNRTSMTSFRAFVITLVAAAVVLTFTVLAALQLAHDMPASALMHADPAVRAAAQTSESSHHNYGMQIVTALLTFLAAAIGANVVSQGWDRNTSREREEARARGTVAGVAAAAAVAKLANGHGGPAVHAETVERVEVTAERPAPYSGAVTDEVHAPRTRPTGDARHDDERGEL